MKRVDYNIEYAHAYSDQEGLSEEQIKSSEVTKEVIEELKDEGKSFVITLLIDEYHPDFDRMNFNNFLQKLASLGVKPTYIAYESRMVSAAKLLLDSISEDVKKEKRFHPKLKVNEKTTYLKHNGKKIKLKTQGDRIHFSRYTCALLSSAWALLRMGVINSKRMTELTGLTAPKPFAGERIINVLPKKYEGVEEANREIISASSEYEKFADRIESKFFEV